MLGRADRCQRRPRCVRGQLHSTGGGSSTPPGGAAPLPREGSPWRRRVRLRRVINEQTELTSPGETINGLWAPVCCNRHIQANKVSRAPYGEGKQMRENKMFIHSTHHMQGIWKDRQRATPAPPPASPNTPSNVPVWLPRGLFNALLIGFVSELCLSI